MEFSKKNSFFSFGTKFLSRFRIPRAANAFFHTANLCSRGEKRFGTDRLETAENIGKRKKKFKKKVVFFHFFDPSGRNILWKGELEISCHHQNPYSECLVKLKKIRRGPSAHGSAGI